MKSLKAYTRLGAVKVRQWRRKALYWRPVRSTLYFLQHVTLPGNKGVPLYDVLSFFLVGIFNGDLSKRAKGLAYSFLTAIPPLLIFFFTLVAFCGCEKRKIYDKVPVREIGPLSAKDYRPCCTTPLYDAMGFTLNDIRHHVDQLDNAMVVVTIITDGLENSSREYTGMAVKSLVEDLRKQGWTFTYMGANQDAVEVTFTLSIRNARNFDYNADGTVACMAKDTSTRMNLFRRIHDYHESGQMAEASHVERMEYCADMANEAFDEIGQ